MAVVIIIIIAILYILRISHFTVAMYIWLYGLLVILRLTHIVVVFFFNSSSLEFFSLLVEPIDRCISKTKEDRRNCSSRMCRNEANGTHENEEKERIPIGLITYTHIYAYNRNQFIMIFFYYSLCSFVLLRSLLLSLTGFLHPFLKPPPHDRSIMNIEFARSCTMKIALI